MKTLGLMCSFLCGFACAQNSKTAAGRVPRLSDGRPDLSGVWQPGSTVPGTWDEVNTGNGLGGTGTNPDAPAATSSSNVRIAAPYNSEAAKKVRESFNSRGIDDPSALCLPPGVPRIESVGLFPMKIISRPEEVVMLYEYMNTFRVIPLNTKHPDDAEPTYLGDSVGRWEGDTLVVDVRNFNDKTWLVGTGTFHTDALHVTERYSRVSSERIDLEVIMEDPSVFTKPWVYKTSLMLRRGTRLREYVCAENNLEPERYEKLIKDNINFRRN